VCPERGDAVGLLLPYANKDTMKIHLEHISAQIPNGKHAAIILDQASWHTTKKLHIFKNLTLIPLPAASPELNPCEQVWRWLRQTHLSNRSFVSDEELLTACSDAWNNFTDSPGLIKSLCSRKWATMKL